MNSPDPFDGRTLYTITNEDDERTTITLDKLTADVLQQLFPDVHAWVQETYKRVTLRKPRLSRRERGDLVRALANREAHRSPLYKAMIDEIL